MSRSAYNPPAVVSSIMFPMVAALDILSGQSIGIDAATGNATVCKNNAATPIPCIGISVNNAAAGQTVYIQDASIITVPKTGGAITVGHLCGDTDGTGNLNDLGASLTGSSKPKSAVGILILQTSSSNTIAVIPIYSVTSGPSAVSSVFGRTGAVVKNAGDYAVADVTGAAPLASPGFTGTPTAPTTGFADDSTSLATTHFARNMAAPHFTGNTTLDQGTVGAAGITFNDASVQVTAGDPANGETKVVITLSPAQITNLDNTQGTFIQAIAAPGAGKIIAVDGVISNLQYAGTPYATGTGDINLSWNDGAGTFLAVQDILTTTALKATNSDMVIQHPNANGATTNPVLLYINKPVGFSLTNATKYTAGNSSLVVTILYRVIPAA